MALPSYDDIHLPLLKLIHNNSVDSLKEVVEVLEKEFYLTDEDLDKRVNCGVRKFYSQVSFSKKRLIEAGLIFKGVKPFRTTDNARRLLAENPKKITNHNINELIKRRQFLKAQREKELGQKLLFESYDEYLQKLKKIHHTYFEQICGLVLSKIYNIDFSKYVEITPKSNDRGIDGILHLGEDEESKVYFQSKCLKDGSVGEPWVTQFSGALDRVYGTKGYYVTTTKYTPCAKDYVKVLRYKEIILIDGYKLVELIFKYKLENAIKLD
ncbi:restriction endonuclease [Bacillus anthracis]|uniref:restriction endonuclease n=1 Tax=Bacillus anthracis TaxID=1392 RepID=UPI0018686E47|nr:restriction endonuclease [Bacillus anthracis]MBE3641229.1 restriction endonuclease [Bacillus anthracis]MDA2122463.1 restriction endonuclease [Bacillus cereus]